MNPIRINKRNGFSLMELLCVIVILAILLTLYTGAIGRAYTRVKSFLGDESPPPRRTAE